ncbi:hypothetical protein [Sandarakinorhabdus sp. DWP1-3-1]|uniref:hypothetical protein n=1 Tax=Sandarakinorhabdus sp. DWP1-3-1 TaxID=2804627 RepID=UPI003CFAD1BB
MRFFPILLCVVLAGCGGMNSGKWPSLAPRAGEISPMVPRTPLGACAGCGQDVFTESPEPAPIVLPPVPADVPARLDSVEKAVAAVADALPAQRRATEAAIARAAGTRPDSNAASDAEVERSRLELLYVPLGAQERALDAIEDDLAGKAGAEALAARTQALRSRIAQLQGERL